MELWRLTINNVHVCLSRWYMKTNILVIVTSIASVMLLSTAIPYALAQQQATVPSTAVIIGVCGVLTAPGAINYGPLAPNATSTDQTLQIRNTGNAQETVVVRGTDWNSTTSSNALLVSATHYSLTSGQAYNSKTALTNSDAQLTTLNALQTQNTFWQLRATLNDPSTVGPVTQVVTLTGQC
jgi:hypothetical protein